MKPDFTVNQANIEPIVAICQILKGLPLGIELAVAQLRYMAPKDLHSHLNDYSQRSNILFLGERRMNIDERHHSLWNAIDWSYQLLDGYEQELFRQLGIFVGKFHWMQGWPWSTERGGGHNLVVLREDVKQYGLDYVWEVSGKQLALKNYCDYAAHLEAKGLLESYRDHVEARGPNSMAPEMTKWSGKPWPFADEDYVDIVTGKEILKAIDTRPDDRPFFLFGSFCGPHKPYDPPASFLDAIPEEAGAEYIPGNGALAPETQDRLRGVRRAYKAMIACIDAQIGLILDKLEREKLLDSTVILFTSDHGEMLGDHNAMSKMQPWHQSVVVPTAVRHPDHITKETCYSPLEITDLTATILDIAGVEPQQALSKPWPAFHDRVPCRSLMPIIRGESTQIRDFAFSECRGIWQMIQTERWKYILYQNQTPDGSSWEELYDLIDDPHEQNNLVNEPRRAAIRDELREKRIRILDATPPAQTGWAPYLAQGK